MRIGMQNLLLDNTPVDGGRWLHHRNSIRCRLAGPGTKYTLWR